MKFSLPFEHTYWVLPGKLLAGPYPGSHDPDEALHRLRALVQCGIRRVINLMDEEEIRQADPPFLPCAETLVRLGEEMEFPMAAMQIPVRDQNHPSPDVMNSILDQMDRFIAAGRPVYVHCWGGRGGTGMVVGCHLIRGGLSGEEGLKRLDELRQSASNGHLPSPKTEAQKEFVRCWRRWDRKGVL